MHTAHVSHVRSAILDYYQEGDSGWFSEDVVPLRQIDPHYFEHESRIDELVEEGDEEAAFIHRQLAASIRRANHSAN